MKRWWLVGVFVFFLGFLVLSIGAEKSDKPDWVNGKEVAPNEVLIKFKDASWADIENAKLRGDIEHAKKIGGIEAYRFRSSSKKVADLISLYAEEPKVVYVEPNFVLYADTLPNDPRYSDLWGMAKINAPLAWSLATGTRDVTVGVVDTGVDYTHPDLAANVWTAPWAFNVTIGGVTKICPAGAHGYNAIRETFDPMDDNDHGTHVSGTIGAVGDNNVGVVGVNWFASIMGLKFLGKGGSGNTADAVDAIEFAIQAKLKGAANVRVLSNSWGGGYSTYAMREEIERAYDENILFICSAGNSGRLVKNYYLPNYNVLNLLAVAASDPNDYLAGFSNYGDISIHLAAPGVSVLSTIRKSSYAYFNGTSMAAPHVSGTAALVIAKWGSENVDVNVDKLRSILINSVDTVNKDPEPGYPDANAKNLYGKTIANGRLNASTAVSLNPGGVSPFPDFVMSFISPMKTIVRGSYADFVLELKSYFDYSEANLKIGLACCKSGGVTVKMLDPDLNIWVDLSQDGVVTVALGANQTNFLQMRVETATNASVMDYRISLYAQDEQVGTEAGPFLYHNDTAYLTVKRR